MPDVKVDWSQLVGPPPNTFPSGRLSALVLGYVTFASGLLSLWRYGSTTGLRYLPIEWGVLVAGGLVFMIHPARRAYGRGFLAGAGWAVATQILVGGLMLVLFG
jgi:hypothetical protein